MTILDLLQDARSLIDEYNSGGVILPEAETIEIDTNALRYINMGLNEIYLYSRNYETYTITQTPTEEQKLAGNWLPYQLPDNFGELDRMVLADGRYKLDQMTQLEGYKTLYLSPYFEGTIRVVYKPRPPRLTDFSAVLPINNVLSEQYMVFYVAAKIAMTELPDRAGYFEQKANDLLIRAMQPQPAQEIPIVNVY